MFTTIISIHTIFLIFIISSTIHNTSINVNNTARKVRFYILCFLMLYVLLFSFSVAGFVVNKDELENNMRGNIEGIVAYSFETIAFSFVSILLMSVMVRSRFQNGSSGWENLSNRARWEQDAKDGKDAFKETLINKTMKTIFSETALYRFFQGIRAFLAITSLVSIFIFLFYKCGYLEMIVAAIVLSIIVFWISINKAYRRSLDISSKYNYIKKIIVNYVNTQTKPQKDPYIYALCEVAEEFFKELFMRGEFYDSNTTYEYIKEIKDFVS